jgi:DNA-binding response OmpR family regulator
MAPVNPSVALFVPSMCLTIRLDFGEVLEFSREVSLRTLGTANANAVSMKKTILVVEDDISVRESVENVLRAAGYDPVLAAGGSEAIIKFESAPIDLVLMDIGLPNQNGWQTCRHLALNHANVPIIVMTGQPGQFKAALAAGVAALMEKPLDAQELLGTIQSLLKKSAENGAWRTSDTFYYVAHEPSPAVAAQ